MVSQAQISFLMLKNFGAVGVPTSFDVSNTLNKVYRLDVMLSEGFVHIFQPPSVILFNINMNIIPDAKHTSVKE